MALSPHQYPQSHPCHRGPLGRPAGSRRHPFCPKIGASTVRKHSFTCQGGALMRITVRGRPGSTCLKGLATLLHLRCGFTRHTLRRWARCARPRNQETAIDSSNPTEHRHRTDLILRIIQSPWRCPRRLGCFLLADVKLPLRKSGNCCYRFGLT